LLFLTSALHLQGFFCVFYGENPKNYLWGMSIEKFKKDSMFHRIKASYLDESSVVLSQREEEKKARLAHVWSLRLNNKYSASQAIQIMMRDYKISQATAYREYNWAMQIFGDLDAVSVKADRLILQEALWNAYQKAVKSGQVELEIKALKVYASLFNFEESENQIDPEKIQAHEYNIKMPRRMYKVMDKLFKEGVVDFNNLEVEDIDYNEVTENDETDDSDK
jgi:hypothetical protein